MSAICGVIGLDGRPWTTSDLDGMLNVLAPLGRDGGGTWAGTSGRCGVAVAVALRHSTPEDRTDRQPAQSEDGQLVLAGDLRVDNRRELSSLLGVEDVPSSPDSAFALAAYERWGDSFPGRLQGEFALAIVDRRRGGLLLARDHAGSRPLAIHERAGLVGFASTALALTGFEGVGHQLDTRKAMEVLALVYSSERTFVEGVRWLPPATALWASANGIRRWTWWKPVPTEVIDLGSLDAHAHELREAFDHAVEPLLRSNGRIGAMLSGGLDSTSAAATTARQLAPNELRTYTSAPARGWLGAEQPNWDADESPLVERLAALYPNLTPTFVHVEAGAHLFDSTDRNWELGAIPRQNPCNWLWLDAINARAARDGVTTLLSGRLGNLFFSSDGPNWLAHLVRERRFGAVVAEAQAWSRGNGRSIFRTVRSDLIRPLAPKWYPQAVRGMRRQQSPEDLWFSRTALRPELRSDVTLGAVCDADHPDFVAVILRAAAGQAENIAVTAAVTGIEERDPTVDRRVIEISLRQPEWRRRQAGVTRAVVRSAMSDRLPPEIVWRTRRGEQLPDWLDVMTGARPEIARELEELEQHQTSRELIDAPRLRRLVEHWPDRMARADRVVMANYRQALLRGLLISRYLRWFERRQATIPKMTGT